MAINFVEGDMVKIKDSYGREKRGKVVSIQDSLFPDNEDEVGKKIIRIQLDDNKQYIEFFKLVEEFDFIVKVRK